MPCGRADLRNHGAAHSGSWRLGGHALPGRACFSAGWNGPDVLADERLPFGALAEADLQPTARRAHTLDAFKAFVAQQRDGREDMSEVYTGGCACGAIRYEISGKPLVESDCQCRDCQRKSGTGHGSYLTFPNRQDVKLTGEAKHWDIVGDSGNVKTRSFCPN